MSSAHRSLARIEDHRLGRREAAEALAGLLAEAGGERAWFVGVFGEPGSGKTTFMQLLRARVAERSPTIWLDAWGQARQDVTLWRKLLFALVDAFNDEERGLAGLADTEYRRATQRRELDELTVCLFRSQQAREFGEAAAAGRSAAAERGWAVAGD